MKIEEIGEFGLIDRLSKGISYRQKQTVIEIGDDAAAIENQGCTVFSSDLLAEGIHFDLTYTPLKHLGYKAVAVNLSDICAMNAKPTHILVSLALSSRFTVEAVEELYKGIHSACENYHVELVGGDTTASRSGLIISVTAIGLCEKEKLVRRKGASNGDIICVTGDLGAAYLGLQVLEREKQVFLANPNFVPQLENHSYLVMRQLKPEARTDIISDLQDKNLVPTSMIDISDGLASELLHLKKANNLGINIFEDKIPIAQTAYELSALEFKISPMTCALNGGEDYELLFSISQDDFTKIEHHPDIAFIGFFTDKHQQAVLITKEGKQVEIQAQGWKHF
jgi:thiamine-monophosphate kinase